MIQKRHVFFLIFLLLGIYGLYYQHTSTDVWENKTILIEGDSIQTERSGQYLVKASKLMGAKQIDNHSVWGASLAFNINGRCKDNSVYYRIKQMEKNKSKKYDIYIIAAGTNDWSSWAKIKTGNSKSVDPACVSGAVNSIVRIIHEYNPDAVIIFVTPIFRFKGGEEKEDCDYIKNEYGYTMVDYRNAIVQAANYNGVKVINGNIISNKLEAKNRLFLYDYLHPTKFYSTILSRRVFKEFKQQDD